MRRREREKTRKEGEIGKDQRGNDRESCRTKKELME